MGVTFTWMWTVAIVVAVSASRLDEPPAFVVRDVRAFDGERVAEHRSVLVQDGRISRVGDSKLAVPTGTAVIDGRGRTLLLGLMDAHVHVSDDAEADLRQSLALGVTTVFDMFSASTRFERIKALRSTDRPDLADVRTAGTGYGVLSYAVSRRAREIGVRMALGARRVDVLRMVLGQAALLAGAGMVGGVAAALATTQVLEGLLFGVTRTDTATFAVVPILLGGVALLAAYVPASRATRVDPAIALRVE